MCWVSGIVIQINGCASVYNALKMHRLVHWLTFKAIAE